LRQASRATRRKSSGEYTLEIGLRLVPRWCSMLATTGYSNTVALKGTSQLCTGVIVGPKAILTAQHCYCDGLRVVVQGLYEYADNPPETPIRKLPLDAVARIRIPKKRRETPTAGEEFL